MKRAIFRFPKSILPILFSLGAATTLLGQGSTVYPQGHIIIGFTKASQNDVIYDLGLGSGITNGQTWSLGTLLTTNFTLSTVDWGVIGETNGTNPKGIWTTTDGSQPNNVINNTTWNAMNSDVLSMYQNLPSAGAGQFVIISEGSSVSWYNETDNNVSSPATAYNNEYEDPNVTGLTSAYFWYGTVNNTPSLIGKFTLNSSGTITYNTISTATPPPPQITAVTRLGTTTTVSFTTTNGTFTYALCFTNSAGLRVSETNWPVLSTTVTGDGTTKQLTDTTTDTNRFYHVTVH